MNKAVGIAMDENVQGIPVEIKRLNPESVGIIPQMPESNRPIQYMPSKIRINCINL